MLSVVATSPAFLILNMCCIIFQFLVAIQVLFSMLCYYSSCYLLLGCNPSSILRKKEIVCHTFQISINGLLYIIKRNSTLRSLKTRDCRMLNSLSVGTSSCELPLYCSRPNVDLYQELRHGCTWEYLECGWGFHSHSLESLRPSISILRSISIGLGSSLCERTLFSLTEFCPLLEIVILKFQVFREVP